MLKIKDMQTLLYFCADSIPLPETWTPDWQARIHKPPGVQFSAKEKQVYGQTITACFRAANSAGIRRQRNKTTHHRHHSTEVALDVLTLASPHRPDQCDVDPLVDFRIPRRMCNYCTGLLMCIIPLTSLMRCAYPDTPTQCPLSLYGRWECLGKDD